MQVDPRFLLVLSPKRTGSTHMHTQYEQYRTLTTHLRSSMKLLMLYVFVRVIWKHTALDM